LPHTETEQRFYFAHSYHAVCDQPGDLIAVADYGGEFAAGIQRGNIFGVQFHPEKSHRFGMALFKRFLEL
jgi:glutamine amidotransferase